MKGIIIKMLMGRVLFCDAIQQGTKGKGGRIKPMFLFMVHHFGGQF